MTVTVTYAISTDTLNQEVADDKLVEEILADAGITKTLESLGANRHQDTLDVRFDLALSAGEKTTLDGLVAAHDGVPKRTEHVVAISGAWEPGDAGVARVIANGRLATEIQDGITGFAAAELTWPRDVDTAMVLCVRVAFILKAAERMIPTVTIEVSRGKGNVLIALPPIRSIGTPAA